MRKLIALGLLAAFFVGCSKPRVDASSDEALAASTKKIAESLSEKDRQRFAMAMTQVAAAATFEQMSTLLANSFASAMNKGPTPPPPTAATIMKRAHGLTADEVVALADKIAAETKSKEMAASEATKRTAEAEEAKEAVAKAAQAAYFPSVEISGFKASKGKTYGDEDAAFVEGEVKNRGDRTLSQVEVTFVFLDASGKPVHEETYHPVLVTQLGFGRDNTPLKPNYSRRFKAGFKNPPSEWAGKMEAKITTVEFSK